MRLRRVALPGEIDTAPTDRGVPSGVHQFLILLRHQFFPLHRFHFDLDFAPDGDNADHLHDEEVVGDVGDERHVPLFPFGCRQSTGDDVASPQVVEDAETVIVLGFGSAGSGGHCRVLSFS